MRFRDLADGFARIEATVSGRENSGVLAELLDAAGAGERGRSSARARHARPPNGRNARGRGPDPGHGVRGPAESPGRAGLPAGQFEAIPPMAARIACTV